MLARLMKHEWRATARMQLVLALAALGLGVLATVALRIFMCVVHLGGADDLLILLTLPLLLVVGVGVLTVAFYPTLSQLLLAVRFYRHKFTDQGYLTFTLPVNAHQLLLSAMVNMILWQVVALVVVVADFALLLLFGTTATSIVNTEVLRGFFEAMRQFGTLMQDALGTQPWALLPTIAVSFVFAPMMMLLSIVAGASLAKKHKALAAFGIYYGISTLYSTVMSFQSMIFALLMGPDGLSIAGMYNGMYLLQALTMLVLAAAGYGISYYLMHRKLNLP